MRPFRLVCFVGLVAALVMVWSRRDAVIDAYTEERESTELRMTGSEFSFEPTPIEPSPFVVHGGPPELREASVSVIAVEAALPPVVLEGGEAELSGTVTGPEGPVEGAVVHIERHVVGGSAKVRVITGPGGAWRARGLLGGRFLVRAFVPGQLADLDPQVFFLAESEDRTILLDLAAPDPGLTVNLFTSGTHYLGLSSPVALTVGREVVDAEGRMVLTATSGTPVTLTVSGSASLVSASTTTLDSSGAVRLVVRCNTLGPADVRLSTWSTAEIPDPGGTFSFALPACQDLAGLPADQSPDPTDG